MRVSYEVRVIEPVGSTGRPGRLIARYTRADAAKRCAERHAHDHHYGTVICRSDGLYDFGDSAGYEPWPADEVAS
jgi:hypothetical protein